MGDWKVRFEDFNYHVSKNLIDGLVDVNECWFKGIDSGVEKGGALAIGNVKEARIESTKFEECKSVSIGPSAFLNLCKSSILSFLCIINCKSNQETGIFEVSDSEFKVNYKHLTVTFGESNHFVNTIDHSKKPKEKYSKNSYSLAIDSFLVFGSGCSEGINEFSYFVGMSSFYSVFRVFGKETSKVGYLNVVNCSSLLVVDNYEGGISSIYKCVFISSKLNALVNNEADHAVSEGGGLSSARRKIEAAGGAMQIEASPRFALILSFDKEVMTHV